MPRKVRTIRRYAVPTQSIKRQPEVWITNVLQEFTINFNRNKTENDPEIIFESNIFQGVELPGLSFNPQFISTTSLIRIRDELDPEGAMKREQNESLENSYPIYTRFIEYIEANSLVVDEYNKIVRLFPMFSTDVPIDFLRDPGTEPTRRQLRRQVLQTQPVITILGEILLSKYLRQNLIDTILRANGKFLLKYLNRESSNRKLIKWDRDLIEFFRQIFRRDYCDSSIYDCTKKSGIKTLLMFDNIHDFGKPRLSYKPRKFEDLCTDDVDPSEKDFCIVNYILKLIADKNKDPSFYDKYRIGERNYFGNGWEFNLLDEIANKVSYIKTTNFTGFTQKLKILKRFYPNTQWSNDTVSSAERKIIQKMRKIFGKEGIILYSSAFDGFKETFPVLGASPLCVPFSKKFNVEGPYDNMPVEYNLDSEQLVRNFNQKYGEGGIDVRDCTDRTESCDFKRADVITSVCRPRNEVSDNLIKVAEEAKYRIDKIKPKDVIRKKRKQRLTPEDIFNESNTGFFLTLKAFGDFMQLIEAKERDIIFVTQDSMQFLIGAIMGTKVVKAINTANVYYANIDNAQINKEEDIRSHEEEKLSTLTLVKLRNIAKAYKLRGYSKLKKKDLIAFILEDTKRLPITGVRGKTYKNKYKKNSCKK